MASYEDFQLPTIIVLDDKKAEEKYYYVGEDSSDITCENLGDCTLFDSVEDAQEAVQEIPRKYDVTIIQLTPVTLFSSGRGARQ